MVINATERKKNRRFALDSNQCRVLHAILATQLHAKYFSSFLSRVPFLILSWWTFISPVATVFIDFRQAFDQLWAEGCIGKLKRLGIPKAYVRWIESWLENRSGFIEINDTRSRAFRICRGGPQGSCLTPAIFITYHSDMWSYIENSIPNFFADDLACVIGGRIGAKYSLQCLDLERTLNKLFHYLEYYTILAVQPVN